MCTHIKWYCHGDWTLTQLMYFRLEMNYGCIDNFHHWLVWVVLQCCWFFINLLPDVYSYLHQFHVNCKQIDYVFSFLIIEEKKSAWINIILRSFLLVHYICSASFFFLSFFLWYISCTGGKNLRKPLHYCIKIPVTISHIWVAIQGCRSVCYMQVVQWSYVICRKKFVCIPLRILIWKVNAFDELRWLSEQA